MAKRFYNTSRIEEDWYLQLNCKHRELLRYCESKCDGAGIFSFSASIASIYIGEPITAADLDLLPVSKLPNGKYFVVGFCLFQNGKLNPSSPPHKTILKSIEENGVRESVLFSRVVDRVQSTPKEQEQEKEIEEEQEIHGAQDFQKQPDYLVLEVAEIKRRLIEDQYQTSESMMRLHGFSKKQYDRAVEMFVTEKSTGENELAKSFSDCEKHFVAWCKKNVREIKADQSKSSTQQKLSGDYGTLD